MLNTCCTSARTHAFRLHSLSAARNILRLPPGPSAAGTSRIKQKFFPCISLSTTSTVCVVVVGGGGRRGGGGGVGRLVRVWCCGMWNFECVCNCVCVICVCVIFTHTHTHTCRQKREGKSHTQPQPHTHCHRHTDTQTHTLHRDTHTQTHTHCMCLQIQTHRQTHTHIHTHTHCIPTEELKRYVSSEAAPVLRFDRIWSLSTNSDAWRDQTIFLT